MPRTLKRRSDAIADDGTLSESPEPPRQRRRSSSGSLLPSPSVSPDPETQTQSNSNTQMLIKKLVRLALSTEYARLPLRRSDISQKILKDNNASHKQFKPVFAGAQKILQHTFGMTLVELPNREKTTLKDRRAQATQGQTQKSQQNGTAANKSWILVSTLPPVYKQNPAICPPSRASSQQTESEYTALYTFVLSLIYLNGSVLTDAKLERYMKRVNADTWTPAGATDKLLQRMVKEGYIEKRRDTSSGEELVEWVVGPRGKVEVGVKGVANLVKGVYGFGGENTHGADDADGDDREQGVNGAADRIKIEEDELDRRLERSLGIKMSEGGAVREPVSQQAESNGVEGDTGRPRRGRPRKNDRRDSDDD